MRHCGLFALTLTLACTSEDPPANSDSNTSADAESETGDGDSPIGLVCDPSSDTACAAAGGSCCSDDPAAVLIDDLAAQVTPDYEGRDGEGIPLFSAGNNPLSRWGYCAAEGTIGNALVDEGAEGCPVPCDPRWAADDIEGICGPGRVCCQTVELQIEDCVLDPNLGDNGCWRTVTGNDIVSLGGLDATTWSPSAHATHQDPSGTRCMAFVRAIPPQAFTDAGVTEQELLVACYRRLGVADSRGLCMANVTCPFADPSYVDACEQLNLDDARSGCN